MKKLFLLAALAASTSAIPAAADAALLHYEIFGAPGFSNTYSFDFILDTSRAPSFFTSDTVRFAPTTITYTIPGDPTVRVSSASNLGPSFFLPVNQGGISILRLPSDSPNPQPRLFGPALISGPITAAGPASFLTGTFSLSDMPKNVPSDVQIFNYIARVTDVTNGPAVPEPATWAMMIAGFRPGRRSDAPPPVGTHDFRLMVRGAGRRAGAPTDNRFSPLASSWNSAGSIVTGPAGP